MTGAPCKLVLTSSDGRRTVLPIGGLLPSMREIFLDIGAAGQGMVSYLGIRGGFAGDLVMGSASRDVLAGIGPEPVVAGAALLRSARPGPRRQCLYGSGRSAAEERRGDHRGYHCRGRAMTGSPTRANLTTQEWRVTPGANQGRQTAFRSVASERIDAAELPSRADRCPRCDTGAA